MTCCCKKKTADSGRCMRARKGSRFVNERVFIAQMIGHAGYNINFSDIDPYELRIATIQSANGVRDGLLRNPFMFPSSKTGEMYYPDSIMRIHWKILRDAGLEHIRFHDLRHPYVKPMTKKFLNFFGDFLQEKFTAPCSLCSCGAGV